MQGAYALHQMLRDCFTWTVSLRTGSHPGMKSQLCPCVPWSRLKLGGGVLRLRAHRGREEQEIPPSWSASRPRTPLHAVLGLWKISGASHCSGLAPMALQAFLSGGPSLIPGRPSCPLYLQPPEFSCSPNAVYASGTESMWIIEGHLP